MGHHQQLDRLRELAQLAREAASIATEGGRAADRHLVQLAYSLEIKAAELERDDSRR